MAPRSGAAHDNGCFKSASSADCISHSYPKLLAVRLGESLTSRSRISRWRALARAGMLMRNPSPGESGEIHSAPVSPDVAIHWHYTCASPVQMRVCEWRSVLAIGALRAGHAHGAKHCVHARSTNGSAGIRTNASEVGEEGALDVFLPGIDPHPSCKAGCLQAGTRTSRGHARPCRS